MHDDARDVVDHPLELVPVQERDPPGLLDRREQPLILERERRPILRPPGRRTRPSPAPWRIARRCRPSRSSNGRVEVDPERFGHRLDHPGEARGSRRSRARRRRRPAREAPAAVGDQSGGVGPVLRAEPLADRAPADRAVEREVVRRQLLEAPPAAVARAMLAVAVDRPSAPRRPRRRPGRRGPPPCPGRGPPRPSRPAATGSSGGRRRGRPRPRPGACGGGSASGGSSRLTRLAVDPDPGEARAAEVVPERRRKSRCRGGRRGP